MVAKPPEVGFGTCEACTVNTGLLPCAEADDGSAESIGDTVGLGVLEGKSSNDKVRNCRLGELVCMHESLPDQKWIGNEGAYVCVLCDEI